MAASDPKPKLYCHTIDSTNLQNDPTAIETLYNLSQAVFASVPETGPNQNVPLRPEQPPEIAPSSQLSAWTWAMEQPNAILVYASPSSTPNPSEALGVFHALPRTQPEIGHEIFHLRVAAVKAESRGLGIFPLLMGKVQQHARDCGWREMTVFTYPDRFVKMARILRGNGWVEVARRDTAVLFRMSLE